MAFERDADVTLEYIKKCMCLQVHKSLLSSEKE